MAMTTSTPASSRLYDIPHLENDGSNFQPWKYRIKIVLKVKKLLDIVTGDEPDPGVDSTTKDTTAHDNWVRRDKEARAQITLTISDEPLNGVLHAKTSKDVFEMLNMRYEGRRRQTTAYLIGELFHNTFSDDSDLEPQLNSMRHKAYILRTPLKCPLDDVLVAAAMIGALPPSYSILKTILMFSDDSLDVDKVIFQILNEEKSKRQEQGLTSALVARTQTYTKSKGKPGKPAEGKKSNSKKCDYCKKKGHVKDECRKLKADNAAKVNTNGNFNAKVAVVDGELNDLRLQLFMAEMLVR
ncbi:unnamed protein product [Somion occarium]|uniref:CCHC-type domain-containing protein n=1 Tax=Somion occarium TaxID=3059160 RepID=A0ABP1CR11_9APHY